PRATRWRPSSPPRSCPRRRWTAAANIRAPARSNQSSACLARSTLRSVPPRSKQSAASNSAALPRAFGLPLPRKLRIERRSTLTPVLRPVPGRQPGGHAREAAQHGTLPDAPAAQGLVHERRRRTGDVRVVPAVDGAQLVVDVRGVDLPGHARAAAQRRERAL